jgi:hypothetical protein
MADLDTAGVVTLSLAALAGVVAAVEKLSGVRRDWRGRPMPPKKQHIDAPDSTPPPSDDPVPVTRRGRPSLTTLSDQVPVTRAEFEARVSAICEDVAEIKADVRRLDDWRDRFEVEMVRGVGGINTRLETLRGRIAGLYELVTRGRGRR